MKSVGVIVAIGVGVFVGAVAMEIVHRVRPNLVTDLQENTKNTLTEMGGAFKKGYRDEPAEEPSS